MQIKLTNRYLTKLIKMTDPSSSSHPEIFKTNHMNISWIVDFDKKILKGSVEYEMEVKTHTCSKLVSFFFIIICTKIVHKTVVLLA